MLLIYTTKPIPLFLISIHTKIIEPQPKTKPNPLLFSLFTSKFWHFFYLFRPIRVLLSLSLSLSMADSQRNKSGTGSRCQPSRLQRRAPASLQIAAPASSTWNVAIPLLSPLATSPTSPKLGADEPRQLQQQSSVAETEKVGFKKWQHPAAPFGYGPAPRGRPFVPV